MEKSHTKFPRKYDRDAIEMLKQPISVSLSETIFVLHRLIHTHSQGKYLHSIHIG